MSNDQDAAQLAALGQRVRLLRERREPTVTPRRRTWTPASVSRLRPVVADTAYFGGGAGPA